MEALQEREWRRLEETIRRGNCVLVLGSDIVLDPDGSGTLPLSSQFAMHLAEKLESPVADDRDLPLVAHTYLHDPGRDRLDLELEAEEFYARFKGRTTAAHIDLASLPFTLCLTATPDDFMAEAFRQAQKTPEVKWYDISAPGRRPDLSAGRPESPIVYGLFGNAEHKPSLVLSETDLLDFVVTVGRGPTGLPDYIAGQLADPQTSFLFLGFGFQRWYTRVLLHVLKTHGHNTRSLALEGEGFFAHPEHARAMLFFGQASSIVFRREDWADFAAELRRRYEASTPRSPAAPELDLTGAPKVFLCHDSRDADLVGELGRRLNELGIDTWRDRQNLRGGQNWDRQIERVLTKAVNYVVVCETPGMVTKGESYFHAEIDVALKRQRSFPDSTGFVWPVTLQPGPGLPRFDDPDVKAHRIDVTTEEGVKRLAEDLLAAWRSLPPGQGRAA